MTSISDFSATTLAGDDQPLSTYAGQVVLVVNTASRCGLTPQYEGLEQLWQTFRDRGLVVLGFPCNQFAGQEPGDAAEIAEFCSSNYGVSFPMFAKIDVNGEAAHPMFAWLTGASDGAPVAWNFTKFLLGRDGALISRYEPPVTPQEITGDIEKALAG